MDERKLLPNRGRVDADVDTPAAAPDAEGHLEWQVDEAIEETFPASDPPSTVQPGSLASRNGVRD